MPTRRHALRLAELGIVLAILAEATGCQTTALTTSASASRTARAASPAAEQKKDAAITVAPQMVVAWQIEATRGEPSQPMSGKAYVEADGKLSLGPYGSVAVAGMSPQEASNAVARHLSRYVQGPKVHLSITYRKSQVAPAQPDPQPAPSAPAPTAALPTRPSEVIARTHPRLDPTYPTIQRVNHETSQSLYPEVRPAAPPRTPSQLPQTIAAMQGGFVPTADEPKTKPDDPDKKGKDDKPEEKGKPTETAPAPNPVAGAPPHGPPHPPHPPGPVPTEMRKVTLPPYVIEPPDILLVEAPSLKDQPIRGQHYVRPDGTINLGIYGSVYVAGLTLEQAKREIVRVLEPRVEGVEERTVNVDVLAYNSKVYYVITDGAGLGEQVYRLPVTGNETVLDAIGQINGLPPVSSKKHIWIARRDPHAPCGQMLPVDWISITQHGCWNTNYQVMPGDRIYVQSDPVRRFDTNLAKWLSPIERVFGVTLLASQTVNSIKGQNLGGGTGGIR